MATQAHNGPSHRVGPVVPPKFELWPAPAPPPAPPAAMPPPTLPPAQAKPIPAPRPPTEWISKTRPPPEPVQKPPPPAALSTESEAPLSPKIDSPPVADIIALLPTQAVAEVRAEEVAPQAQPTQGSTSSVPKPAKRRPPNSKKAAAALVASTAGPSDAADAEPPKPRRKPPPPSNAARKGTNHRAAVLAEQCAQPPTAQLTRFNEDLREDLRREYKRSLYEHMVIEVASTGTPLAQAVEQTERAAEMFTIASNTGEIMRAIGDSLLVDYFGAMASYTRGTADNAHNGAQDFYIAEQELSGVHRQRYSPIEQEQLSRLRVLEAELSAVGRRTAFERISNRGGAGGLAKDTNEITEEEKEANQREKARLFAEQERVLSGAHAEEICVKATEVMLGHFTGAFIDPAVVGEDVAEYTTFLASTSPTTVYNISRQVAIEVEVADRRASQAAAEQKATAASGAAAAAPASHPTGAKRGRARTAFEERYEPGGVFTVTPAPHQRRKKKEAQPSAASEAQPEAATEFLDEELAKAELAQSKKKATKSKPDA